MNPIVYAEDDENDVYFAERAFQEAGIPNNLIVLPDGLSTIEYLTEAGAIGAAREAALPALILLDINLPGKSGLEVLKWIRAQPAFCATPVLMLTSSSQDADIHRAYILGANGFLQKPGKPQSLLGMVKALRDFWLVQNRTGQGSSEEKFSQAKG